MGNNSSTEEPPEGLKFIYDKLAELDQQQKLIDHDRDTLLAALKIFEPDHKPKPKTDIPESLRRKKQKASEHLDINVSDLIVDFEDANTMEEKVFSLCVAAHDANKLVNNGQCAQYLIDHGQSKATHRNLSGTLGSIKRDWPGHFEKIKQTTHRYVPDGSYEPSTDPTEDLPDDTPDSQDSSQ